MALIGRRDDPAQVFLWRSVVVGIQALGLRCHGLHWDAPVLPSAPPPLFAFDRDPRGDAVRRQCGNVRWDGMLCKRLSAWQMRDGWDLLFNGCHRA